MRRAISAESEQQGICENNGAGQSESKRRLRFEQGESNDQQKPTADEDVKCSGNARVKKHNHKGKPQAFQYNYGPHDPQR